MSKHDQLAFSIYFKEDPYNYQGTNPPNPKFNNSPILDGKNYVPDTGSNGTYPVGIIKSKREPYSIDHVYTQYGELETKLGTNIGTNFN